MEMEAQPANDTILEFKGVSKDFPGVRALDKVDFDLKRGEVHALVGENGSGKSTLLGIASGFVHPDEGTVEIAGSLRRRGSPAEARRLVHRASPFASPRFSPRPQ